MIGVREIVADDTATVIALARAMQAEAPQYRDFSFEEEKVLEWISLCVTSDDWLGLLAVDEEAGAVGMLAVGCVPMLFSSQRTVDDIVLYVHPAWRGTTAAVRMVRHMEAWAKARGGVAIRIGITTGTNNEAAARFLERFGYERTGLLMTKPC